MATEFSAWFLLVFLCFIFFMYESARRIKDKKFIEAYSLIEDITREDKEKKITLKSMGEFKSEFFNQSKRCYEMRFKKGFMDYYTVYSRFSIYDYFGKHLIRSLYWIMFLLRAQFYEKRIEKPYKKELGWSVQAMAYRTICFLFNISGTGIPGSFIICGLIFGLSFPDVPYAVLIGFAVAIVIDIINYKISTNPRIYSTLLKKKTEMVNTETFLVPLEADTEIVEIFKIRGIRYLIKETVDGAKETKINNFIELKDTNLEDLTLVKEKETKGKDIKTKDTKIKYPKDKEEDKYAGYMTVKGYDELYKLKSDRTVKINEILITGEYEIRKRRDDEYANMQRSYLARNKFIAEQMFALEEENEKLQQDYENLVMQLENERENRARKIKDSLLLVAKEKERQENLLPKIYTEIFGGKFVGDDLEEIHKRVMLMINRDNMMEYMNKFDAVLQGLIIIMDKLKEKANVKLDAEVMKYLELKPPERIGIENQKQKLVDTEIDEEAP